MGAFIKLKHRFNNWYGGKLEGADMKNGIPGHIRRPWLAGVVNAVRREYKWIITTLIAIIALLLVYFRE